VLLCRSTRAILCSGFFLYKKKDTTFVPFKDKP
jgi:hypothetical protein